MPPFSAGDDAMSRTKKKLLCKVFDRILLFEVINLTSLSHTLLCRPGFLHANKISKIYYNDLISLKTYITFPAFTLFLSFQCFK